MRKSRTSARLRLAAIALLATVFSIGSLSALPEGDRALKMHHLHTGEEATIVFKRNGVYDKDGLQKLNYILRDWRIERPTNMDPHLFDLLWAVYQESGATEPIQIVCGYRSPSTNALLRRRSSGVAEHSQHMLGKATDFYIPGVPLEKLREIGLRMQVGGVGFYPTSGTPFVHMDTGGVRMWPRMTREQLVRVFPQGKTLYVPSDGKPLPGYDLAFAAYKARMSGETPAMLAEAGGGADTRSAATDAKKVIVLTPQTASVDIPLPRRRMPVRVEPQPTDSGAVLAMAQPLPAMKPVTPVERTRLSSIFNSALAGPDGATPPSRLPAGKRLIAPRQVDFDATYGAAAPPVPAVLARAMAARDQSGRSTPVPGASLPIAPTAVVATVDVTRPARAAVMTYAAFSGRGDKPTQPPSDAPAVLAYATPEAGFVPEKPRAALRGSDSGTRAVAATPARALALRPEGALLTETNVGVSIDSRLYAKLMHADLTLTAPDTESLRLWMAAPSTREKRYALLTLPDFSQQRSLLDKPVVALASSFGRLGNDGLRTDSFSGQLIQPLAVVDLTRPSAVAAR